MPDDPTPLTPARGAILDPDRAARCLDLRLVPPIEALAPWVAHHWLLDWDVPQPFTQSVLGRPCPNLVVDGGQWMLSGTFSRRFDRVVEGAGRVYGTQLRPGFLRALTARPVGEFIDCRQDMAPGWGVDAPMLEAQLAGLSTDAERVALLGQRLLTLEPRLRPEMAEASAVVELLEERTDLRRVAQLSREVGRSERSLQRLLAKWVGLSAKALMRRFRLQEASARLAGGQTVELTELAYSLGYADQAHFSRDFKRVVGVPPSHYGRRQAAVGG